MVRNIKPTQSKEETQNETIYQVESSRDSPVVCQKEQRQPYEGPNPAAYGGANPLNGQESLS
jgi:hypothetical protein